MRHIQGYTWDKILEEEVPKTFLTFELINEEQEQKSLEYEKANQKANAGRKS